MFLLTAWPVPPHCVLAQVCILAGLQGVSILPQTDFSQSSCTLSLTVRLQTWKNLGLSNAPHWLEEDGKVMVPPKWKHILEAEYKRERSMSPGV